MKINVKGLIFVGFAAAVFANAAQAAGEEKIVTSQKYVDAKILHGDETFAQWDGVNDKTPSADKIHDKISSLETTIGQIDGQEYTEGAGIDITNHIISNEGVRSIASDNAQNNAANGTITVNTNGTEAPVAIKGLDNAAYKDVDAAIIATGDNANLNSVNLPTTAAVVNYVGTAITADAYTEGDGIDITDHQISNTGVLGVQRNGTDLTLDANQKVNVEVPVLGVQAAGADLTPDANKKVNVPVMVGADGTVGGAAGLVPAQAATDDTKFLRGDGTWVEVDGATAYTQGTGINITNHQISNTGILGVKANNTVLTPTDGVVNVPVMVGADGTNAGVAGLVPTSGATDGAKVLSAAGSWAVNHTTAVSEGTTNGTVAVSVDGAQATDVAVHGLDNAAYKDVDTDFTNTSSVNLPTTAAVANYVTGLNNGLALPAPAQGQCTANAPCALVLAGDQPTWEIIQQ